MSIKFSIQMNALYQVAIELYSASTLYCIMFEYTCQVYAEHVGRQSSFKHYIYKTSWKRCYKLDL